MLRDYQILVLFGKWGSGKRTLANQIASKLAIEGLNIRVVRHFISIPDDLASTCSTVLILEDPIKFQYTDLHNAEIFDCLLQLKANAEKTNCFQVVVFHCEDIEQTEILIKGAKRNMDDLFPKIFRISFSTYQLTEIVKINGKTVSLNSLKK